MRGLFIRFVGVFLAFFVLALALPHTSQAQDLDRANKLSTGPEPEWVEAREAVPASVVPVPPGIATLGAYIEYWGSEILASGSRSVTYERRITRIQQTSALTDVGVFRLDYSPDYQSVKIHRIDLIRGGQRIPVLKSMNFRVSKVESGLERLMLSGKSAAIGQIPDARAGDVIDVAYSVTGQNPVFGEHFVANVNWNHPQYVHKRQVRLLHSPEIKIASQFMGPQFKEAPSNGSVFGGRYKEQVFTQTQVLPAFYDNKLPKDYSPFLILQLSSMGSWYDVHQWAAELFRTEPASPAINSLAKALSAGVSQKQAIAKAAKFVQDDIRYFSVSISENTHRPQQPDVTLERRFGDCKDKALLLVTLLRAMGVRANPVLVSDSMGRRILGSLPTPLAFDHAVVQVVYSDRSEQMIDATLNAEDLPLEHQSAKLQRSVGLVIQRDAPYYVHLKALGYSQANLQLSILESVKVGGLDKESTTTISTRLQGALAGITRQSQKQQPESTRLQFLTDNYLQRYPSARKRNGFPVSKDIQALNQFEIEEAYTIERLLSRDNTSGIWFARFNAQQLLGALSQGGLDKDRWLPLGLPMPGSIQTYRVEVEFPPEIQGQDDPIEDKMDTPFFQLNTFRSFRGNVFTFQADLKVTADEILPGGMADFVKAYQDAQKKLTDIVIVREDNVSASVNSRENYRDQAEANRKRAIVAASKIIDTGKIADEDIAEVYLQRAAAYMDLGQMPEAEADITQAVRRSPNLGIAFQVRATWNMRNKRLQAAESDLNKAIGMGSEPSSAYLRRGQVRYVSGNYAGALRDFEQAEKSSESGLNNGFMRVWQALARKQLGLPGNSDVTQAGWPNPLLKVISGIESPQAMLQKIEATKSREERTLNLCEAYFYLALWSQTSGREGDYRRYLQKTLDTGVIHFMEYELATVLLK